MDINGGILCTLLSTKILNPQDLSANVGGIMTELNYTLSRNTFTMRSNCAKSQMSNLIALAGYIIEAQFNEAK